MGDICYEKYGKKVPLLPREAPNMASQSSQAGIILRPRTGATSGAGIRRRGDPDRDFHCEMVGRGPKPRALQRYRLARLVHNCDSHEVFIPDHSTRRIEVDPAGAGNVDLDPSMGVSAGDFLVVVIAKMPDLKRNAASKNVERC